VTLDAGSRLGPYEIVSALGAGGMGEVYRAKDSRLGREVAIKVLPAAVAQDPERLRRFEQEARAASAIHHPNLLTVFDVGSHEGTAYLVTELLSGESLRDLMSRGPLTTKKACEIATQASKGLAAAHEKGIVHRDLKPENLFVTKDGITKILDFGLAKVEPPQPSSANVADSSTLLETSAGTVLGTVGYMSPEQLRGERADARSDLFSLAVVLHEMLAGARPFAGNTAPEVMSAILRDEPSPLTVPDGGDGRLESIVRRCLEKRPEHRFQSARDLAFALETLAGAASPAAVPAAGSRRPSSGRRRVAALLLGAAIVTGGFLLYSAWRPKATETTALTPIRALAVLPFANVSGDPAQEYFAEGFTDELTTTLADFSALKVIARTSAASYKGTDKRAARIGQNRDQSVGEELRARHR
jgi:serine/threonine protein kinase